MNEPLSPDISPAEEMDDGMPRSPIVGQAVDHEPVDTSEPQEEDVTERSI